MNEPVRQGTAQGLYEADLEENNITMAPNVGPLRSAPIDRREIGDISLDRPATLRLATPEEFNRSRRSQASSVR